MNRASSDRASVTRKRALRRLARQEYAAYRRHYAAYAGEGHGKDGARSRAWTALRGEFSDDYLSLYALEQVSPGHEVPPEVRSKAWSRAMAHLRDMREAPYALYYERARGQGLSQPAASYRAAEALREREPELFAQLMADEIRAGQDLLSGVFLDPGAARVTVSKGALEQLVTYARMRRSDPADLAQILEALGEADA